MSRAGGHILVGTSGYSFDDWKGRFYPDGTSPSDMLVYYSKRFPMVEVNYTYYRLPSVPVMRGMEGKTPSGFEFVVKLNRALTHANPVIGSFLPNEEGGLDVATNRESIAEDGLDLTESEISLEGLADTIDQFKAGVAPLVEAGKLRCILAQFPWGFENSARNLAYIVKLARCFNEFCFVVEFRNSGWVSDAVFDSLKSHNIGFCCVDEPRLKGLFPPLAVSTSPSVSYVRFHGRNSKKWWNHDNPSERYDYLYTEEELQPWVDKILRLSENSATTYVLFNNCHEGKATENARQMQSLLGLL